MNEHLKENRPIPRAEVRFPTFFFQVKLHATFSSEAIEGGGTVVNLSTGGCKIESDMRALPGGYMAIRLYVPDHEAPIRIDVAAVRWSSGHDFGAEFISISPDDQVRLREFLNTVEQSKV